jgi:hypothetical protein
MTFLQSPDGYVFETEHPEHHAECTRLTLKAGKAARRAYCIAELRKILQPGQTVYTILRHVSASGMQRRISLCTIVDGEIRHLDRLAADAMDDTDTGNGIKVSGCGMDMGFHLVYNLGRTLWPDGFDLPAGARGRNGNTSGHDTDGGYALNHSWL